MLYIKKAAITYRNFYTAISPHCFGVMMLLFSAPVFIKRLKECARGNIIDILKKYDSLWRPTRPKLSIKKGVAVNDD